MGKYHTHPMSARKVRSIIKNDLTDFEFYVGGWNGERMYAKAKYASAGRTSRIRLALESRGFSAVVVGVPGTSGEGTVEITAYPQ